MSKRKGQQSKQLVKENKRLRARVAELEQFFVRGLPHKEVLDTYVNFVNLVGKAEEEEVLAARNVFFNTLEPWLQLFLTRTEVEECSPQQDPGVSQSEPSDPSSDNTSEATPTEPTT